LSGCAFFFAEAFGGFEAVEDAEDAFGEGLELVFAGVDAEGGDEGEAAAEAGDDARGVGHAAGEEDGVDFTREDGGHGAGFLGDLIDHGFKDEGGFGVAGVDAALDFAEVAGTEVGEEAALAEDHAVKLVFVVDAAETELDQFADGEAAGAVGAEGTFFNGVRVDGAAMLVGGDGDAAAHVGDDEAEVGVGAALFGGEALGDGLGVEGMADGGSADEGGAGDAGAGLPLVDGDGIDDVGVDAGGPGELEGEEGAEVGGVLATAGEMEFLDHGVVNEVGSAGEGGKEAAAAGDGDEGGRTRSGGKSGLGVAGGLKGFGDEGGAIVEAGDHGAAFEAGQFLVAMEDGLLQLGAGSGVDAEFGGSGAGVDGEDAAGRLAQGQLLFARLSLRREGKRICALEQACSGKALD